MAVDDFKDKKKIVKQNAITMILSGSFT